MLEKFKQYVETVLKGLVDDPDKLSIKISKSERNLIIAIYVPSPCIGQIVGTNHKTEKALKTVFWAASGAIMRDAKGVILEFVESEKTDKKKDKNSLPQLEKR